MIVPVGWPLGEWQPDVAMPRSERPPEHRVQATAGRFLDMYEGVHARSHNVLVANGVCSLYRSLAADA
jgi:hypothetical protein